MLRWNVVELAADPPGWPKQIEAWADRYPDAVTSEYRTNLRKFMATACAKLHSAVINHAVTHDGDPRLARHIANAIVKETRRAPTSSKSIATQPAKSTSRSQP